VVCPGRPRGPAAAVAPMKPRLTPPNPLRSEADAFGFLVWFVCLVAAIAVIVLIIDAL
jgi:hypothetical protein